MSEGDLRSGRSAGSGDPRRTERPSAGSGDPRRTELPPHRMHAASDAQSQRGGTDGRDGASALESLEVHDLEGQREAATFGMAEGDARHRAIFPTVGRAFQPSAEGKSG